MQHAGPSAHRLASARLPRRRPGLAHRLPVELEQRVAAEHQQTPVSRAATARAFAAASGLHQLGGESAVTASSSTPQTITSGSQPARAGSLSRAGEADARTKHDHRGESGGFRVRATWT